MLVNPRPFNQLREVISRAVQRFFSGSGRAVAVLLTLLLIFFSQPLSGQPPVIDQILSPSEKEWLRSHPEVRVGFRVDWPPFEMMNDRGQFEGITTEYMRLIQRRLGIIFRSISGPAWHELISIAQRTKLDLLPGLTPTAKREKYLNFTRPFVEIPRVIITRTDEENVHLP